jgi:class 3 adenylate cyclase/tetratricopeptide (TPR) repeat protein
MKFPVKCHSCGSLNPLLARFCFNCGEEIACMDSEGSGRGSEESRKNVAVIFADVSGFTALSEKMDPEEVREILNECFDYITRPVYELEGTIDKYMGDCVMVLFGARYSHSDDPKRAVICAMKMMDRVHEFSRERLSKRGIDLNLSIGINYGLVVSGGVGNYFDRDYTVLGDTVNTAQRLQAAAQKGTVLVSQSIYEETRDTVHYSDAMEFTVKNKEKPVRCYSPITFKLEQSFDDALIVEREREIRLLEDAISSVSGPRFITVVGEPGVGKTSLIRKLMSNMGGDVKKIWVNNSPMYKNRAYYTVSSMLYGITGTRLEDSGRVKRNSLAAQVDYILRDYTEEEIQKNFNFLGLVMGLERDAEFQGILNSMDYSDVEREILDQFSLFIESFCRKNNVIFILDDMQWADASSSALLSKLESSLKDGPMFILTSRYEKEEPAGCTGPGDSSENTGCRDSSLKIVKLEGLSGEGTRRLICSLSGCGRVDDGLLDRVMKYSGGNPLFIKEFITAAARKGMLYTEEDTACISSEGWTDLPDTMESLILANLSGLDSDATGFLQAASAAGKEFNLSWIRGIVNTDSREADILRELLKMNIISLKSIHGSALSMDKVYVFNQDMVREAVYSSILNKRKKEIHRSLGELIESRYGGEIDNYCEVLYLHFENAGLKGKAREYCYRAALKYKNSFNLSSALEYYHRLVDNVDKEGTGQKNSRIVNVLMDMAYIYTVMGDYDNALMYLDRACSTASLSDDLYRARIMMADVYKEKGMNEEALSILEDIQPKVRQAGALYGKLLQVKCSIHSIMGEQEAVELAERSEKILLRAGDFENLSETMSQAAIIYFIGGDVDNALSYLNKAYSYAEKINNLRLMARISGNLGIIYHSSGMVSKAQEHFVRSIELSDKISNIQSYISGNMNLGILYMDKGLFRKAGDLFREALSRAGDISAVYQECVINTNLGDLMYEKGDYDEALAHYKASLDSAREFGFPVEEAINYMGMARLNLKLGKLEDVPGLLDRAEGIFNDSGEVSCLSDCLRYKAVFELAGGNTEKAGELCQKALEYAGESGSDMKKLKALRLMGVILSCRGDHTGAVKNFDESISLAVQLESDYEAAKGFFRRHEAQNACGREIEADGSLLKAREAMKNVDGCRWDAVIG